MMPHGRSAYSKREESPIHKRVCAYLGWVLLAVLFTIQPGCSDEESPMLDETIGQPEEPRGRSVCQPAETIRLTRIVVRMCAFISSLLALMYKRDVPYTSGWNPGRRGPGPRRGESESATWHYDPAISSLLYRVPGKPYFCPEGA